MSLRQPHAVDVYAMMTSVRAIDGFQRCGVMEEQSTGSFEKRREEQE